MSPGWTPRLDLRNPALNSDLVAAPNGVNSRPHSSDHGLGRVVPEVESVGREWSFPERMRLPHFRLPWDAGSSQ